MSLYVRRLPASLARVLLGRLEDPKEDIEVALPCARTLNRHERWLTQRLFDAVMALHGRHPKRGEVLLHLNAFVRTHTDVVLKIWADAVEATIVNWLNFAGSLRDLPASALDPYPEARKAVAFIRKLPRR